MARVNFKEDTHQYFVGGFEYLSVTQYIEHFVNPFDAKFWSTYKALEQILTHRGQEDDFEELKRIRSIHSPDWLTWVQNWGQISDNLLSHTQNEILTMWAEDNHNSIVRGNIHHKREEDQAFKDGGITNRFTKKFAQTYNPMVKETVERIRLTDLPTGCYPELRMFNEEVKLAGTSDLVFIEHVRGKKFAWVDDHKTNKQIDKMNPYQKMKFPLLNLDDCNYNHYRLQLGIYAWMLEEAGYTIKGLGLRHLNHDNELTNYNIRYSSIRPYVVRLMDHRRGRDLKRTNGYGFGEHQIYAYV